MIDSGKAEDTIKASLEKFPGGRIKAVDCPSDQKVEPGATFACTVIRPDGSEEIVTLKIRNSDADVDIVDLGKKSN